jgi:hypothetical protein
MPRWPLRDYDLRAMYAGGRGNRTASRFARFWAAILGLGVLPRRWVTLEVTGRHSGRLTRFPLGMADRQGRWYLVSMLGEDCNWVQNVRAHRGGRSCAMDVPKSFNSSRSRRLSAPQSSSGTCKRCQADAPTSP